MSSNPASPNDMSPQEKRDLLEKLLREKAAQSSNFQAPVETPSPFSSKAASHQPIQRIDRDQKYFALSSAQQRLWLLDQFGPGNPVYNISIFLRLKGELNLPALEKSLTEIQNRHEILRANFTMMDGKPVQFLVPERLLTLSIFDLQGEPEASREIRAEELAEKDSQRSFDLARDALARANLFNLAENDHVFQFVIHHIVFDGWSLNILLQELTSLYGAYSKNEHADLPALPVQYIDFAGWEAGQNEQGYYQEQLAYWKNQLGQNIPLLDMPLDKPRPDVQTFRAGKETLEVSSALTQTINALCRQEGVTLFVSMLSVFYVLLARYTAQEDIIVGTPIARRNHPEVEKLIGVFLNNLALRTDLSGNISFLELLKRVRHTALDAFANQEIPFEKVINELRIERDSSHTPVFQVFFNLLDLRKDIKLELPNLTVETPSLPEIGSIFDITLYVQNWGDTLKLKLVYNADLFQHERMQEFLLRYHHLLEQIIKNPDQQIFSFPLPGLASQKYAAISETLNRLTNNFSVFEQDDIQQSLTNRFEQQVDIFPQAIAVKTPQYEWTYEQLNHMANQAAHSILKTCDPSQEKVALLFEHDAPMLAGMLGALKAVKTYIPLDPSYPEQRLAYMLEDSWASVIITNTPQLDLARSLAGAKIRVINIDEFVDAGHRENPCIDISPDTLAYILYTSGSTGQPKGVMQTHRNVLHFIKAYTNNLHIGALDRLSLLSSYSFDAAIMDIFGALLNGATLYPIDLRKGGLLNLAQYLKESQITIYHSTPTVYRYFLNSITEADVFPSLRLVVLGGEAVIKRDVDLYKKHFPQDCVFINGLGPTESTVSLQYFINKDTDITRSAVPVGYPVVDTEVHLLNDAGEAVHLSGEIAICSPYVALGYWQKPDITQAAFEAAVDLDGKRTYRTGDMGCLLPDGTIEFRGRKDTQVKIRGHRVEVGEVETMLAQYPSIKECVVTTSDDRAGGKRLVAYFVHNGNQPSNSEIRHFLQKQLPDYMIPTAYVSLQSFPMTPTGKIDRRALPDPDIENDEASSVQVAARDDTEGKLVKIWQELFRIRSVGIKDNFFELGGHSMMAVHLFTRINQEFGINLPLATLFQEATIEHLAHVIHDQSTPEIWSSLIEIEPQGDHPPFFCVHGITGDILWFRDLARCLAPNYPFYGLQARGLDSVQEPLSRINEMAAHYIEEIRRLQPRGPYLLGGASLGGTVALEIAQQLVSQGEEVSLLAIFDHSPANVKIEAPRGKFKKRLIIASRILKNFPAWLKEFLKMGPARMFMRVRRFLRIAKKVQGRKEVIKIDQLDATDLIDFAADLPPHRRKLIVSHFQAIRAYDPKPYPGNVTLFRASSRPLLNTADPQVGWRILAPGRVKVIEIPGSHEGMFKEPHVWKLAEKLSACIDQASNQNE